MDFLQEIKEHVQKIPKARSQVRFCYALAEETVIRFTTNYPNLTSKQFRQQLRQLFKYWMERGMNEDDMNIIRQSYAKDPATFFEIPAPSEDEDPETRDAHNANRAEKLEKLVKYYYRVTSLFEWDLVNKRLLRNVPSHAIHEFARRSPYAFRPELSISSEK